MGLIIKKLGIGLSLIAIFLCCTCEQHGAIFIDGPALSQHSCDMAEEHPAPVAMDDCLDCSNKLEKALDIKLDVGEVVWLLTAEYHHELQGVFHFTEPIQSLYVHPPPLDHIKMNC